jgi:hypothetical protein
MFFIYYFLELLLAYFHIISEGNGKNIYAINTSFNIFPESILQEVLGSIPVLLRAVDCLRHLCTHLSVTAVCVSLRQKRLFLSQLMAVSASDARDDE